MRTSSGRPFRRPAALGLTLALGVCAQAFGATAPLPTTSGGAYNVQVTSWRDLPFRTVVRQQYDYSCGSAALATLLHFHYGQPVREAEVFAAMYRAGDQDKIRKVGFSLLDMKRYLAAAGFSSDGYRISLTDFEKMSSPGIALIKTGVYRHFVVVKGVRGPNVLVGDPALGLRIYSRAQFEAMWSGIMFVIDDNHVGRFNSGPEWAMRGLPVASPYLAEQATGSLMRDLPTLYQITPIRAIPN
ncbi:MAG: C39 family peptidase [Caulobacteraceae bacterium]